VPPSSASDLSPRKRRGENGRFPDKCPGSGRVFINCLINGQSCWLKSAVAFCSRMVRATVAFVFGAAETWNSEGEGCRYPAGARSSMRRAHPSDFHSKGRHSLSRCSQPPCTCLSALFPPESRELSAARESRAFRGIKLAGSSTVQIEGRCFTAFAVPAGLGRSAGSGFGEELASCSASWAFEQCLAEFCDLRIEIIGPVSAIYSGKNRLKTYIQLAGWDELWLWQRAQWAVVLTNVDMVSSPLSSRSRLRRFFVHGVFHNGNLRTVIHGPAAIKPVATILADRRETNISAPVLQQNGHTVVSLKERMR